jgi:hypothetical protein
MNEGRSVFTANGVDEAAQVQAFLEAAGIASATRGESVSKSGASSFRVLVLHAARA